jgi:hypothetical protein
MSRLLSVATVARHLVSGLTSGFTLNVKNSKYKNMHPLAASADIVAHHTVSASSGK